MQNIRISKIKVRRGTDEQRKNVMFDQGELALTLDTGRLFGGTGNTLGGICLGSKIHSPLTQLYSLTATNAQPGDLVSVQNTIYQLIDYDYKNITNWKDIGHITDNSLINNGTRLSIRNAGISAIHFSPNSITNGIRIFNNKLQLDYDTNYLSISSSKLTISPNSIDEYVISSSSLSSGLIGGNGNKIKLDIDPECFGFIDNKLTLLSSAPIGFSSLLSSWFTDGIEYDSANEQIKTTTNASLSVINGKLGINPNNIGSGLGYNTITNRISANLTSVDNTMIRYNSGLIGIKPSLFSSGFIFDSFNGSLSTILIDCDQTTLSSSNGILSLNTNIFGKNLYYNTGTNSVSAIPQEINQTLKYDNNLLGINPSIFGNGLYYNLSSNVLSATTKIFDVDETSITKDVNGVISLPNITSPKNQELPQIVFDNTGRILDVNSCILDTLTGSSTTNANNSLSSIFNGTPSHSLSGAIPGLQLTQFTALSSNGSTISLSSAGFILFEGGYPTKSGQLVGRFAIPIFTY